MDEETWDGGTEGYQTLEPLGKGKFSVVYRGRRIADGATVALKKVSIYDMMDAKARAECIREVHLLRSLNHPNVVRYLDSFESRNELVIVFEVLDSGDLQMLVKQTAREGRLLSEKQIWSYFVQVCAGLRHMHSKRVMHRDIKPSNVFLGRHGIVKLGDLGLGRYFSSRTLETHSLVGTPYYMSPERLHESGYDFKSDMWSLGCLLYEMAALHSPFYGKGLNLYSLTQKIDQGDYPELPPRVSPELREMVRSLLQPNPATRPDIDEVYAVAKQMADRVHRQ